MKDFKDDYWGKELKGRRKRCAKLWKIAGEGIRVPSGSHVRPDAVLSWGGGPWRRRTSRWRFEAKGCYEILHILFSRICDSSSCCCSSSVTDESKANTIFKGQHTILITDTWVTWPEHPQGAKDKVKESEGPPAGSQGWRAPKLLIPYYFFWFFNHLCLNLLLAEV